MLIFFSLISYQVKANDEGSISFGNKLVDAANNGDLQTLIHLCKNGYHVDSKGLFGATPLMRAAYNGNVDIAKELLKRGADPSSVDYGGATPLHIAARMGHQGMVRLLVDSEPKNFDRSDNDGWTPLMRATISKNNAIVKFLLKKGADPQKRNKWHNDAFTDAVMSLDHDLVKIFVDYGILSKLKPDNRSRLLNNPKVKKDAKMVKLLQDSVKIAAKTNIINKPTIEIPKIKNQFSKSYNDNSSNGIFNLFFSSKDNLITKEDVIILPKNADAVIDKKLPQKSNTTKIINPEETIKGLPWLHNDKKNIIPVKNLKIQPIKTASKIAKIDKSTSLELINNKTAIIKLDKSKISSNNRKSIKRKSKKLNQKNLHKTTRTKSHSK